jgi:chromosome segregation ATPase
MMKVEAGSRRREDETRESLETKVNDLQAELQEMSDQSEAAENVKAELAGVKDEMELMMHTKSLFDDTTERLNIYKEKLQQLTDVKEVLQREEEAHSRSVDENLRLQYELNTLQPLKRQLEDYKSRTVEAEVCLTETQDELQKLKQQRQDSSDTHENLKSTIQSQDEEINALRCRIKQEEEGEKEAAGLGEGISEMNPDVREELLRLRNENVQLKAFAEKREDDAVAKLELEADDAQRLSERYKSQFLSTKGTLETALIDLQQSIGREEKLQEKLTGAAVELDETHNQLQESVQQLARTDANLEASRTRESKLEEELSSWVEQARNLQERTDDMTRRLQRCSKDLEESLGRESELKDSVACWMSKFQDCTTQLSSLSEHLDVQSKELHEAHTHEEELTQDMAEWIEKAKSASELANDISDQLKACSEELNESRNNASMLQNNLSEVSETLKMKQEDLEDFKQKLLQAEGGLEDKGEALALAHKEEMNLQHELAAMTSRAENAEDVSKERMEMIENLEEELRNSECEVESLTERGDSLASEVEHLKSKLESKMQEIEVLQNELHESAEMTNKTKKQLVATEEEVNALRVTSTGLENELTVLKEKNDISENDVNQLQQELSDAQETLSQQQRNLEFSQSTEADLKEQLDHATHLIFQLEGSIKEERNSKTMAEEEVVIVCEANEKMEEEMKGTIKEIENKLEEEKEFVVKVRNDLRQTQEALNEAESSLGAAQHREKMLQHKNTMLEDQERELQAEIEAESKKVDHEIQEAAKSLEATREVLNSKAAKDMQELQSHMNQLLEDERRAKRQAEEAGQEKIKKLQEDLNHEITLIQNNAAGDNEAAQRVATERFETMKHEYDEKITKVKQEADEESTKLVRKGKGMLKEIKAKQQEETDQLNEEIHGLQEKYSVVKNEKESVTKQFKAKAGEYKKKLQFASGRVSRLTAESDEFEGRITGLEREKYKLREENDRYRRQLGGRFGSDSNGQNQLETLQKELKNACDEIRELKRQRSGGNMGNGLAAIDEGPESADHSYSRDVANHSTISQLRSDYEETIEALNDEKRELVMRNSAAITDIQKAEQRAWESEQQNGDLQQELTSLQLQVERLGTIEPEDKNDSRFSHAAGLEGQRNSDLSSIGGGDGASQSHGFDEPMLSPSPTRTPNDTHSSSMEASAHVENENESSPVPFALGQSDAAEDRPPQCQQS